MHATEYTLPRRPAAPQERGLGTPVTSLPGATRVDEVPTPAPPAEVPPATQAASSGAAVGGKCKAVSDAASDEWCNGACNADTALCPEDMCKCK